MAMTSGIGMRRTRQEAEEIALAKHGQLEGYVWRVVCAHYQRVKDWACQNCGNTGTVLKVNGINITTSDCMCHVIHKRKLLQDEKFSESNIPELYREATVGKWENPGRDATECSLNHASFHVVFEYQRKIKAMVQKGHGLYLTGPNGVGKTFLSCAIGLRAAGCGLDIRYYTMAAITRAQIDGWFQDEAKATMAGIRSADLLIIDDLDKIYRTKTELETTLFDNLLRDRLQASRPCIFTSNRTIDDAKDNFGPHIYSMLNEHCAELVFIGADYRAKMSEQIRRDILGS